MSLQVAAAVHTILRLFAPVVEKASYDDFYLAIQPNTASGMTAVCPPDLNVVQGGWSDLGSSLQHGAQVGLIPNKLHCPKWSCPTLLTHLQVAALVRETVQREVGLSVSCGVAPTKLLARMISPLHKPEGLCALPANKAADFLRQQPIRSIPSLQ